MIGICDDQPIVLRQLQNMLTEICEEWDCQWRICLFLSGEDMLTCVSELTIAFLDIEMPNMDGIELGRCIREKNPDCKIIMATGKVERFKDAFRIQAIRFVTKPFDKEEVKEALEAAGESEFAGRILEVYAHRNKMELLQENIQYIESYSGYAECIAEGKRFRKESSLDELEKLLDERLFMRISRKYIVNLLWVQSFRNNQLWVAGEKFSVSRRRQGKSKQNT